MTDQDLQKKLEEAQKKQSQKWDDKKTQSWVQNDGNQDFSELEDEIWQMDQVEKIQKEVEKPRRKPKRQQRNN